MTAQGSAVRKALLRAFDVVAEATVLPSFSRVGIGVRRRLGAFSPPPPMTGQTAIVTGATSGIGLSTATALASLGAAVHLVGRDPKRGATARAAVEAAGPGQVHLDLVDLSDPEAVAAFGRSLVARYGHVDVLVHSAGALTRSYQTTRGGTELTVATQVLGPYALTAALAPLLWSASPATIVTVSSGGMYSQGFDLARLEMKADGYDGVVAYARSKRAQVVLAKAWARRFAPAGVASFSMHPGWADTPGLRSALPRFEAVLRPLLRTPEEGADTVVWLAAGGPAKKAAAENTSAPTSGFYLDRFPRSDRRLFVGSPTTISDEEALLEWCALRSGVKMPLARLRGS